MKENAVFAQFIKFLRKDNNLQIAIVAVAAIALIVFILATTFGGSANAPNEKPEAGGNTTETSEAVLEARLEAILGQVEGAGRVKALVTFETGPEIVPAVKTDTQSNSSDGSVNTSGGMTSVQKDSEPIVVQGKNGTEPMVLVTKQPVIQGILVVAEGASEMGVRLRLMQAVQVALQIEPTRIEVLPMNISKNREGN